MKNLTQEERAELLVKVTGLFIEAGIQVNDESDVIHKVMISPCSLNEDSGIAFPGGLAAHITLTTAIALKLAKMISGTFQINEASIRKVCACQHLSKIDMFIPNDNQWEIDKRGLNYKFNDEIPGRMKFGDRSIMYAQNNLGVTFNADEWEAMQSMDRDGDEKGAKVFDPILTTIIRMANELAYAIERERARK